MTDLVCFEVNDWHDYPKYFDEWYNYKLHRHGGCKWFPDLNKMAKENKLCIQVVVIDMAISMMFTAPRDWVEKTCPELLTDPKWTEECVYGQGSDIVPHEIKGQPSFEYFLDWTEDNFGAKELVSEENI